MKKMVFIVLMVTAGFSLHATEVKPQAGIESYFGPNGMRLVTPWLGLRLGLSPKTSLLLKYYNHNIRFKYIDNEENEVQRKATLSNLTGAIYVMLGRHHAYGALSLFRGTDGFDASAFDGGVGLKMTNRISETLSPIPLVGISTASIPIPSIRVRASLSPLFPTVSSGTRFGKVKPGMWPYVTCSEPFRSGSARIIPWVIP